MGHSTSHKGYSCPRVSDFADTGLSGPEKVGWGQERPPVQLLAVTGAFQQRGLHLLARGKSQWGWATGGVRERIQSVSGRGGGRIRTSQSWGNWYIMVHLKEGPLPGLEHWSRIFAAFFLLRDNSFAYLLAFLNAVLMHLWTSKLAQYTIKLPPCLKWRFYRVWVFAI